MVSFPLTLRFLRPKDGTGGSSCRLASRIGSSLPVGRKKCRFGWVCRICRNISGKDWRLVRSQPHFLQNINRHIVNIDFIFVFRLKGFIFRIIILTRNLCPAGGRGSSQEVESGGGWDFLAVRGPDQTPASGTWWTHQSFRGWRPRTSKGETGACREDRRFPYYEI